MKYLLKHKLIRLLVVPVYAVLLATGSVAVPIGGQVAASPLNSFAAATVTCGPNEQAVPTEDGSVRSCCPAGITLKPVPKDNEKKAQKATSDNSKACLYAKYINPLINLLSALVGVMVVIGIIIGGIQYSSSAGDPQQAAKGKAHIRNALIALFVYLFFYTALQFLVPGGQLNG